jgi:uncharacterized damage-inducible protein DinB
MSATLADRFRRWFDYEKVSHARVLASLESVPADRRDTPEFQKAVMLLGHLAAARQIWLYRFGVGREAPGDIFPAGLTLDEVRRRVADGEAAWSDYLSRLDDAELARVFEYQSLDAGRFRNTVEDTLAQLFGHSWYHRGQIASLVRAAGGEPAKTDFIFWCRERVPAPGPSSPG